MRWQDMVQTGKEQEVLPWTGGRRLLTPEMELFVERRLPQDLGWHVFRIQARVATWVTEAAPDTDRLRFKSVGYLVGDRLVPDNSRVDPDPSKILAYSETVHLIEPGLGRFVRVRAGRIRQDGPLVYVGQEFPLGPEEDVVHAFQDREASVGGIQGVSPALDAAFRMASWQRDEADRRRAELDRLRAEQEARLAEEERVRHVAERLGDARGRREMAAVDFRQASAAALAVGGAEYLDHRAGHVRAEMVVDFRLDGRRFQCVCDSATLRIVDAGICLVDHRTGVKGDDRFTLESLPGVIRQAQRERRLHVFRHVDADFGGDDDDDD